MIVVGIGASDEGQVCGLMTKRADRADQPARPGLFEVYENELADEEEDENRSTGSDIDVGIKLCGNLILKARMDRRKSTKCRSSPSSPSPPPAPHTPAQHNDWVAVNANEPYHETLSLDR